MKSHYILPKGLRFFLPEEAKKKRNLEALILEILNKNGFAEIITPMISYANVEGGEKSFCNALKFTDRETGRILQLRDDVTPEIAAAAVSILKEMPRPLKLQYHANVFRHITGYAPTGTEIFQSGGEIIGESGVKADIEVLSIAVEIFTRLNIPSFHFSISSVSFFRKLLELTGLSKEEKEVLKEAILRKDLSKIEKATAKIGNADLRNGILELPKMIGKEEVFGKLNSIRAFDQLKGDIDNLKAIYDAVVARGYGNYLLVDIAEIWGYNYYTGAIFECFIPGVGYSVCTGGRYDNLLEKLGKSESAVGFAVNNSLLLNIL